MLSYCNSNMESKKSSVGVVTTIIVLVIIAVVVYFAVSNNGASASNSGRVVFAITDAAANMGSVSSVQVTVDKVEAHSASSGWVTLSSDSKTYDLLQLKQSGQLAVLADTNVEQGSYDQVRLDVSKVVVVDSSGSHEAKLPSSELKIMTNMDVNANSTATATFDFIADESLHVTGNGKYILAPVVDVETRENANVTQKSNARVEVNGGSVVSHEKVGMDINGNVGVGLKINSGAALDLNNNGVIVILGGSNSNSNSPDNGSGNANANVSTGVGIGIKSGY